MKKILFSLILLFSYQNSFASKCALESASKSELECAGELVRAYLQEFNMSDLISQEKFIPHDFDTLHKDDQSVGNVNYQTYIDWYNNINDADFKKIVYKSEGLKVVGIIGYSKDINPNVKLPVIIYNRGGSGNSGKITVKSLNEIIYPLVKSGYIVIASQYRGNDGSEGKDELGGRDVDDVINLMNVINELKFADTKNIFMVGRSRGAVNSYRALQQGLHVNAAAIISGVSDSLLLKKSQPEVIIPLLEEYIPDYNEKHEQVLTERSAVLWPEDINVPVLLMHGDNDKIVDVSSSKVLAQKLTALNKPNKLIIYPNDDHSLSIHINKAIEEIIKWFAQYKI